ncbi:MAG: DUF3782 domain-containing protein [Aquificaceae bacterium]
MKKPEKKAKSTESFKKTLFRILPKLLEKDESFRAQFITFLKPYFAEKEKTEERFNILLEEIKILREEGERRWQEAIRRLDEQERRLEEHSKILQEQSKRLEEHSKILEEQNKKLEEHSKILEEQNKRLEEYSKILQEHSKKLEEHSRILEEQNKRLEEHSKKLELLTQELISLRKRQDVQIGALGARWGLKTERSFRNAVKGLMEEYLPVKVERYEAIDYEGEVFDGRPGKVVELDLIIEDGKLIVAEIKSSVSVGDVLLFEKKVKFFEKKEGKKPYKKVIISPMVEPKALEFCKDLGIVVYTDVPIGEEEFNEGLKDE